MSPVPDPSQNHKGSPLDDLNCESHGIGLIGTGSSSEEEEPSGHELGEYQPLPQGPDNLEEETIDYSSLSGLLSALNTYGSNEINIAADSCEDEEIPKTDNSTADGSSRNQMAEYNGAEVKCGSASETVQTLLLESEKQKRNEYEREQASVWNSKCNANRIEIDENKKEEIKLVMSKITLPNSAIPPWAKELSDEEWKNQVFSRIFGEKHSEDEER